MTMDPFSFLVLAFSFPRPPHLHFYLSLSRSLHDSSLLRDSFFSITTFRLSGRSLRNFSCTCFSVFFSLLYQAFTHTLKQTYTTTKKHHTTSPFATCYTFACLTSYLYTFNHMNDSEGIKNIPIHLNFLQLLV